MKDRPYSTPEGKPEFDQKIEQADEGPLRWLPPVIESAYSRLAPREQELSEQVDPLTIQERKVGQKNLDIVQLIGTPPG